MVLWFLGHMKSFSSERKKGCQKQGTDLGTGIGSISVPGCLILGKIFNCSFSQFTSLPIGNNHSGCIWGFVAMVKEI